MGLSNLLARYTRAIRQGTSGRFSALADGQKYNFIISDSGSGMDDPDKLSVGQIWQSQPHLRTVVDFIAKNIARLGVHTFAMENDGNRDRVRTGEVCAIFAKPSTHQTLYEFIRELIRTICLYDEAYVWVYQGEYGPEMRVLKNHWLSLEHNAFGEPVKCSLQIDDKELSISLDELLYFPGWNPDDDGLAASPVETLRKILKEQYHAANYRAQIWNKNGRFGGYLYRPKDATQWDDAARQRFFKMWEAFTSDSGARAGENPMLEDGMEYRRVGFSAKEEQWAEATKLSLQTCCQVFHIPPVMVGMSDDANYSNVTAYARQLYTNTLGSWIVQLEQRFNAFLLPMIGAADNIFVEFNVEAKLRGDIAEQYKMLSMAIGGPFLSRNEGRRMLNLKPIDGGNEIITPLNVTTGTVTSPFDGGDGRPESSEKTATAQVLTSTIPRIERSVEAAINAGKKDWWKPARWIREISHDLKNKGMSENLAIFHATLAVNEIGKNLAEGIKPNPEKILHTIGD